MTTNLTKVPAEVWIKIIISIVFCGFMVNDLWQIFQHQKTWEGAIHEHWFIPLIIASLLPIRWVALPQFVILSLVLWVDLHDKPLGLDMLLDMPWLNWAVLALWVFDLGLLLFLLIKKVPLTAKIA